MRRYMLVLLLIGTALRGTAAEWNTLEQRAAAAGVEQQRVGRLIAQCRQQEIPFEACSRMLAPVHAAAEQHLPADYVFSRLEEGLAKQVEPRRIADAAQTRLEQLQRADAMIMRHRGRRGGQHDHLLTHLCAAIESGMPESVLDQVLDRPQGFRYGRMIHVIEAGEQLLLSGLNAPQVRQLMTDFLDRDLDRAEIMRAVEMVRKERTRGRAFDEIHAALWVPTASS